MMGMTAAAIAAPVVMIVMIMTTDAGTAIRMVVMGAGRLGMMCMTLAMMIFVKGFPGGHGFSS